MGYDQNHFINAYAYYFLLKTYQHGAYIIYNYIEKLYNYRNSQTQSSVLANKELSSPQVSVEMMKINETQDICLERDS